MANGQMLVELRELARSSKELSNDAALRLTLSALADLYEKTEMHLKAEHARDEKVDQINISLAQSIEQLKCEVADLKKITEVTVKNPAYVLGRALSEHPKLSGAITFLAFVIMNLWFISGFRRLVLIGLGLPPEIIDVLAP